MAMQDEVVIDQRSLREKAIQWRKVAARNIKVGLDATVYGLGVSARAVFRHSFTILVVLVSIAVSALLIWAIVAFYVWLFSAAPVFFWLLVVFNIFNLIAWLLQLLS